MILIKAEFAKEDYIERVISDSASIKNIEAAIKMLEVDESIELVDERNCKIDTQLRAEGGYRLSIVENLINGDMSIMCVQEPILNSSEILKAFDLFLHLKHKELMSLFKWIALPDMADVKREIEQEFEEKYGDFNRKIEDTLKNAKTSDWEVEEEMRILKDLINENTKSTDSLKENYSPSLWDFSTHGGVNNKINCSQCGERGCVHTKSVSKKAGVSGGKATAALLTGGISLLGFGLSRKEKVTEAYCGNCKSTWYF